MISGALWLHLNKQPLHFSQASKCALFLFLVATQTTMESKCMKRIKGKYLAEDFLQSFTI